MTARERPEDPIERHAAELLAQRDGGWTAADAARFAAWRKADPRHDAAVRRLESAQRLLRRLPESPEAAALLAELEASLPKSRRVVRFPTWTRAVAGLAAAAALAFAAWTQLAPTARSVVSYVAAASQHRTVDLTDGSTLLLNSGSEVDVEFLAGERRINLHQGEVHFSVAKDAARPFVVAAGPVRVRAVGTAFNVRRRAAAIEVVVTEGIVAVTRGEGIPGLLQLTAGESATIGTDPAAPLPTAERLTPAATRDRLAWQAPMLRFDHTPLADAVAQFNRHSPMQLEIADAELAARPVAGTFAGNNAEAFANLLVAGGDVKIERVSDTLIVLRRAR